MTKRLSPIGRIVQGNPLVGNLQFDDRTKQPKMKSDNSGQQENWYINVAFDKKDPDTLAMVGEIYAEAARSFPQLFPQGVNFQAANFGCVRADFAVKLIDGDGLDNNGQPHAKKDGFGGHWIVKISTYAGAMRCVNGLQNNATITDPEQIHTGNYVRVALDFKTNGWAGDGSSKPGLYMNPDLVQLVGYGQKIVGGPDANVVFATAAAYVPQGMATTPVGGVAMPGLPAPLALPGAAGPLPTALPAVGLPSITAPAAVAAAPQYTLSPEAVAAGHTKEALNAAGHTDESLLANGYLVEVAAPAPALQLPTLAAPAAAPALALPVIPNHAVVAAVLATPQYKVTDAVAAAGHTLETLKAQGHTEAALLTAGYIVAV